MDATIEVAGLRKRFGQALALDGLSFTVAPGHVTGFVGPNGAGKSTTMRVILGLDAADAGYALIGGRPYRSLRHPLNHVGALLDASALQPSRSGRNHLLWLAHSQGLTAARVDEVIALVGLETAARRRAGGYSLGMRQRLGIAAALLGDPPVLLLDEPVNGLDPEGIVWMRGFLRALAAEGRAVLVSSHLMSELPWFEDGAEPNADMWATADESREQIVGLYHRAHSDVTIQTLALDGIGHVPWWPDDRSEGTLHRILVHMIAETDRHAGHADIVRELIDGSPQPARQLGRSVCWVCKWRGMHHRRLHVENEHYRRRPAGHRGRPRTSWHVDP